ncbi:MAG: hypothetical protein ABL876_03380 [Chitinophagaceae bacterium]
MKIRNIHLKKKESMPVSYLVYGSVGLLIVTLLLFLFSKKQKK